MPPGGRRVAAAITLFASIMTARAGELEPALAALAQVSPRTVSAVVIELEGARPMSDYAALVAGLPRSARPGRLATLMRQDFEAAAAPVLTELQAANGWGVQSLWIAHSIAVNVARSKLAQLAALPGVARIVSDASLRSAAVRQTHGATGAAGQRAMSDPPPAPAQPQAVELPSSMLAVAKGQALNLPPHFLSLDVLAGWQRGHAGQGVTVAVVDSGVSLNARAISQRYRGRPADWFDPYAQHRQPVDLSGHGTLVAGLLVGTLVDDTPIGVAPEARWMAARLFDDAGKGSESAVQRIYQWVLDPDGDPSTSDAPDIVNNSWGLPQSAGRCDKTFARALTALRTADIHVVFAAGNDGPARGSSMSPANNPGVLSVGALNADRTVAARSSRGPSGCGGGAFPSVYAPGVNLPALDQIAAATGSAAIADGTSFAAAAVSGALAVLRGAAPQASSTDIEAVLMRTAQREPADAASADAVLSPDLGAALAVLRPLESAVAAGVPVLRWRPAMEPAHQPVEVSVRSLSTVLPWSVNATEIKPSPMPVSGTLQARGNGWAYQPDPAKPASVRFDVATLEGRRLVVELLPQVPVAVSVAPRQSVKTSVNDPVLISIDPKLQGTQADALRLTSPLRGGKVRLLANGRLQYTPPANFLGTDQFTYSMRGDSSPPAAPTTVMVQVVRQ